MHRLEVFNERAQPYKLSKHDLNNKVMGFELERK